MNDVCIRDRNDAVTLDRQHNPVFDRGIENPPTHRRQQRSRWGGRLFALAGFLLLAGGLSLGAWRYYSQQRQVTVTAERQRDLVPTVRVAKARAADGEMTISLPGTTLAFAAANIFARANGYVETRKVDIGDPVKAGDLLAQITAPELDHQISQAQATLAQNQATLQQVHASRDLAQVTGDRDSTLVQKGWLTPQQGDTDRLTLEAQRAASTAAEETIAAQEASKRITRASLLLSTASLPSETLILEASYQPAAHSCSR
jgi:multidrug efflux pump subunit AcrA (membrane-fusion protein)